MDLKYIIDLVDPGHLVLWGPGGVLSHVVARRAIDLLSQEALPALKGYQADQQKWRASRVGKRRAI